MSEKTGAKDASCCPVVMEPPIQDFRVGSGLGAAVTRAGADRAAAAQNRRLIGFMVVVGCWSGSCLLCLKQKLNCD